MIKAGEFRICFQQRGPVMLVMAARTGESQSQMMMQLTYVYNQVGPSLFVWLCFLCCLLSTCARSRVCVYEFWCIE